MTRQCRSPNTGADWSVEWELAPNRDAGGAYAHPTAAKTHALGRRATTRKSGPHYRPCTPPPGGLAVAHARPTQAHVRTRRPSDTLDELLYACNH